MKRLAASLCALALGAATLGLTASSGMAAGSFQSVTGSGWRGTVASPTTPYMHFAVSVRSSADGVSGTYRAMNAHSAITNFRGQVTCLYIAGNQAIVGGVVTSGGEPGQVGTGFAVGFTDNGSSLPDTMTFYDAVLPAPADCVAEAFLFTLENFPVLQGNVAIQAGH